MSEVEEWRAIPGYPGYAASDLGRIKNVKREVVLSGTPTKEGYRQVCLRKVDRRTVAYIHRLVALAFHGLPPERFVCNHKDANKLNNRASNLEWISVRANIQHAASLGLLRCGRLKGEDNPNVKLTDDEVRQMRAQRLAGVTLAALGRQYGVTAQTAHLVTTGKTWRHLGGEEAASPPADAISAVEVDNPTNPAAREWLDLDGDELAMSL